MIAACARLRDCIDTLLDKRLACLLLFSDFLPRFRQRVRYFGCPGSDCRISGLEPILHVAQPEN